jgi:hypothetical protein
MGITSKFIYNLLVGGRLPPETPCSEISENINQYYMCVYQTFFEFGEG